jgi:hydroxymethylpyrimidine kinase/phosphomethylpyrimidine kinase
MLEAGRRMVQRGAKNVLVKGGHLTGNALDLLVTGEGAVHEFNTDRIETRHTHGSGCTYSAAITAELAKGVPLADAVLSAKRFVTEAIASNPGLGGGHGPLNHFA